MDLKKELMTWLGLALAGLALLVGILVWQNKHVAARGAIYISTDPVAGAQVFKEKGCANCHASTLRSAAAEGPNEHPSRVALPKLVTAMWNHAPRMWERMRAEQIDYPRLNYAEMAQIVAYLYVTEYVDRRGDLEHGQQLFVTKGCVRCHSVLGRGGRRGPDLNKSGGAANPMIWTQVMWNHAAAMQERMRQMGLAWPDFKEDELRDLYAYARQVNQGPVGELDVAPADPENGWRVFQAKGCIACHAVNSSASSHVGPDLGPDGAVPPTYFRFAGSMLNHFPEMRRALASRNAPLPTFESSEMADVIAFVYSLRYLEPGGSPHVGESVFSWRGCNRCHGAAGQGTSQGPALRGRGQSYTAIRLASVLWAHGARMYQQGQKLGQAWPQLETSDVGDILAFLNAPVEEKR